MTNTERLLIFTLPRWSKAVPGAIGENLSDMWLRGEPAGHHGAIPYDPDAIGLLRAEIRRDFKSAPSTGAFQKDGPVQTVGDLDDAMLGVPQKPINEAAQLRAFLSVDDRRNFTAHAKGRKARIRARVDRDRGDR